MCGTDIAVQSSLSQTLFRKPAGKTPNASARPDQREIMFEQLDLISI